MSCLICNEEIYHGDELQCSTCNEFLIFTCAGFREVNFRKMNKAVRSSWSYSTCKSKKNSDLSFKSPQLNNKATEISDEILKGVIESVNFMSSQFDSFGQQLKELISSISQIKNENKRITEQNLKIKNELGSMTERINFLEQKALECNMQIVGVPESKDEICSNLIKKINSKLNINITIKNVFRILSKFSDKPRKISMTFVSLKEKNIFMNKAKKEKLTAKDSDISQNNSAVFFNDQMTTSNRTLFFKARMAVKKTGYKYVWFKNNKVFVKKDESTKAIVIDNEISISKII